MMISCGAAVFTARLALRFPGFLPETSLLPDPGRPALVARIGWRDEAPASEYERQLYGQVAARRTHRGGFGPDPLPPDLLAALREGAERDGVLLRVLAGDRRRAALAAVVDAAGQVLRLDGPRAGELARWAPPPGSPRRDGVPPAGYPAREDRTEPYFPARDFAGGRGWGLQPPGPAPERSAGEAALLSTAVDAPDDWVNAGQALQRLLLTASLSGAAVALHSQPLEFPQLREFIRAELAGRGHPQMVLRIGTTGQRPLGVRRPAGEVLL